MRSTLDELNCVLDELKSFVESIDPVNDALEQNGDAVVLRYLVVRKRLDYAAFIVALYAAFERFVEDIVWSHAELESSNTLYHAMPERLCKKHLRVSGELLARRLGEGKYIGITKEDVVSNLNDCLSGRIPYSLNKNAVLFHEQNFRAETVREAFADIGVENINELARKSDPLILWYCQTQGLLESEVDCMPATMIEIRLSDLVERRNQITHRGSDSGESLGVTEMPERLNFVRAYCTSLFEILAGTYLDRSYLREPGASTKLGAILEGPIRGHIVVVPKPLCRVYVGQPMLGTSDGRVDRWGCVEEIQIDDISVPSVELDSTAEKLGLRVDFKMTSRTQLYLLPHRDNVIWG